MNRLARFWHSLSWISILAGSLVFCTLVFAAVLFRDRLIEWAIRFWNSLTWETIIIGLILFLVSLALSFGAIALVMVKVPPHYFSSKHDRDFLPNSPWLVRWGAVIAKNIAGVFLILLGIVLSLPGVPGQGVLTILLGVIFLDIPGKRPIEARIIKRPAVLSAINKLRAKYNKPPLELDED
ncbi:MAG: hypothetical protein QM785_18500 [Pyrinomonadaceae bacterium]